VVIRLLIIVLSILVATPAMACEHRDTVPVLIDGKEVKIDRCIAPIVKALNDAGIKTVSSCCGHGKWDGYILLEDRALIVWPKDTRVNTMKRYKNELNAKGAYWWGGWHEE